MQFLWIIWNHFRLVSVSIKSCIWMVKNHKTLVRNDYYPVFLPFRKHTSQRPHTYTQTHANTQSTQLTQIPHYQVLSYLTLKKHPNNTHKLSLLENKICRIHIRICFLYGQLKRKGCVQVALVICGFLSAILRICD